MKKIALFLSVSLIAASLYSQDIEGSWSGSLKVQGAQLRLVFHVSKTDSGYVSTMDSPDQGAKNIATSLTTYKDFVLKLEVADMGIRYEGALIQEGQLVGEFRQLTYSSPLILTKGVPEGEKRIRSQDPLLPLPYYTEEVRFNTKKDQTVLAGTLSMPDKVGPHPAVVLISGRDSQDRNQEISGHKTFLVLADYLTRNGIAVLRFDNRGTAESTGDFSKATMETYAADVEAALDYLHTRNEIDRKKIGLVGHSEGALIAPMVAVDRKDVRYIVLMAGQGIRGEELLLLREELLGKASGLTESTWTKTISTNKRAFDLMVNTTDEVAMKRELNDYLQKVVLETPDEEKPAGISNQIIAQKRFDQLSSPWFVSYLTYDPSLILRKVKCPVLALHGNKDLQIPPRQNLTAIKTNLDKAGNRDVTIREYPSLNHLFQECATGLPTEYGEIEQTISPQVMSEMSSWILRKIK